MALPLPIVAQKTMDEYYQNYRPASAFFDLDDFIYYCGLTIGEIYQQEYKAKYVELRSEKQEEAAGFPADWLLAQRLKIQRKDGEVYAVLEKPVMGFSWDNQSVGVQDVVPIKPRDAKLERTTQAAAWQAYLLPFTSRIFWYVQIDRLVFFNKGGCNIVEINVLYVPSVSNDMLVPEGIVKMVTEQTIASMRGLGQGVVVKKSLDGNQNLVLEGEINKNSLK